MMQIQGYLLCITLFIMAACTTTTTEKADKQQAVATEKKTQPTTATTNNTLPKAVSSLPQSSSKNAAKPTKRPPNLLQRAVTRYPFSDPPKQDLFQLDLVGENALSANLLLTITTHEGKVVYKESLPSKVLLEYGQWAEGADKKNEAIQEKHILRQVSYKFFDRKQFTKVATSDEKESIVFTYKISNTEKKQLYYDGANQTVKAGL